MSDAQDTIELPAFGLTLTQNRENAWRLGDIIGTRIDVRSGTDGMWYVVARVMRDHGMYTGYEVFGTDLAVAVALMALDLMTPDDVAAIRALGERS